MNYIILLCAVLLYESRCKQLPRITFISLYMGPVKYPHLPLLLKSMKMNPSVTFSLINILDNRERDQNKLVRLKKRLNVDNFNVKILTLLEFRSLVFDKLGIHVDFDSSWYYKMCDYKPTIAYLFPHLVSNVTYQYWGYGDMDVIWGNMSEFAHWFQGDYPLIHARAFLTDASAQFHVNEYWTHTLFLEDPVFVQLLRNRTYFNLDETGALIPKKHIINSGYHAIGYAHVRAARRRGFSLNGNRGKHRYDNAYLDEFDCVQWAGPVLWSGGSLQLINKSTYFPSGRKLMYFHRPRKRLPIPHSYRAKVFEDMALHGYLLPNWMPLDSRFFCPHVSQNGIVRLSIDRLAAMKIEDALCFPHKRK